jgi:hypothetical protein
MSSKKQKKTEIIDCVWDLVNWDIDFETFEWFLHLCEINNRHLETDEKWAIWPDWPSDMPDDVDIEHRQAWLNLLQFIHDNEHISVCQNLVRVNGDHGTTFFLEMLGVESGWGHIPLSQTPPDSVMKILEEKYDNHPSCKSVPCHLQHLCLEPDSSGIVPTALSTILMLLINEVNVWDLATDYQWVICEECGNSGYISGRKFPPNHTHGVICSSCSNDAPLTN